MRAFTNFLGRFHIITSQRSSFGPILSDDGVEFQIWAPAANRVDVVLTGSAAEHALIRDEYGFFRATVAGLTAGARYQFRIDGDLLVADPASNFQPDDVHAPSEIIDQNDYPWTDGNWCGRPWEETVLYELHVGTFTPEGTYRAAIEKLDELVDLGITAVELMPLAESPGLRNWGYDGVLPYAPERCYGRPNDLKALIDAAHARGLMMYIDVVYNHFGPDGNYLHVYAKQFFTERFHTPWGVAINMSGEQSEPVRRFFIENALYWLDTFHFDGIRFDAVHEIHDPRQPGFLDELSATIKKTFKGHRFVHLVLENDDNRTSLLTPRQHAHDLRFDAQWNDDAHHALIVATTGESDHYYSDYASDPIADLMRALTEGFVYQGEFSAHRGRKRGFASASLPLTSFVFFAQNHDQIGNRALGDRLGRTARPAILTAVAALTMLSPMIPMLFMGEEWNASTPFLFFCDFDDELAKLVTEGRRREFSGFPEFASEEGQKRIPDPALASTYGASKLKWDERLQPAHAAVRQLYRELLTIRRRELMPRLQHMSGNAARCVRLGERTFTAEYGLGDGSTLHLFANLGENSFAEAPQMRGRLLFATDTSNSAIAGPWTVRWSLQLAASTG